MTWVPAAWAWLKKNWQWVLLPVGAVIWLLGRSSARKTVVVESSTLNEHEKFRAEVESETRGRLDVAESERRSAHVKVETIRDDRLKEADAAARAQAKALESNPEELNDFLKKVGRSAQTVRRKS